MNWVNKAISAICYGVRIIKIYKFFKIRHFLGHPSFVMSNSFTNQGTIEEVYEPFLIKEGYLMRTPRGRQATDLAFKHLGRIKESNQGNLF